MISPDTDLLYWVNEMPGLEQEQQRIRTLEELGLLKTESVPIFEEATQTAAHFLDAPICVLGLLDRDRLWFKSAVGLSRIGLMNDLASSRQLPRHESFCTHVVDNQQVLMISDATINSTFAETLIVQRYGIRSYLGVPLIASDRQCIGTLAVMGLVPREFTHKDAEILQLIARWSISEFERNQLKVALPISPPQTPQPSLDGVPLPLISVKTRLISQMTQELCTPLTSILGMAKVLSQGIYGTLTDKQREYIEIIHNSGQYLSSLINEVMELGALDDINTCLNLNPIDVEMLCQQALSTLKQAAQRYHQQIQLTVEPGSRLWLLDKDKVRQMLYHLVFSVVQSSTPESVIRIHISRKQNCLNIMLWTSHPWLGDGLPQSDFPADSLLDPALMALHTHAAKQLPLPTWGHFEDDHRGYARPSDDSDSTKGGSRLGLGLLLSRQLAELHGGSITVQGALDEGYRYVIKLPQLSNKEME